MGLYVVFLRKPNTLADMRSDPFWEFGSFGRTGCHRVNLLHPRHTPLVNGDRLAFLQGGQGEIRVVAVSPPITVGGSNDLIEVEWSSRYRPLPFLSAPLLINNLGDTAFPEVRSILRGTRRSTYCGAAASRFRSKSSALNKVLEKQILSWFKRSGLPKISTYPEAIQSKDRRWYKHVLNAGWATRSSRLREYARLGRTPTRRKLGVIAIGPKKTIFKGAKSRC
jgi:hypothetical protein